MTDAAGGTTAWEYDEIGRPKTMTASDSLPASTGTLSYAWDYDDKWVGAVTKTTDPAGTTEFAYDEFGREANATRTYPASATSTSGQTAEFKYDHDLSGHLTSKVFPSGRTVNAMYKYGYLTRQATIPSGATAIDYTLMYAYNDWGLMESATSTRGHMFANTFTTPLWPDNVNVTYSTPGGHPNSPSHGHFKFPHLAVMITDRQKVVITVFMAGRLCSSSKKGGTGDERLETFQNSDAFHTFRERRFAT